MNILQVLPYDRDRPGGVRTHILELSRELQSRGHKVAVLASGSKGAAEGGHLPADRDEIAFTDLVDIESPVEILPITTPRRFPLWGTQIDATYLSSAQRRAFNAFLSEFKPDLVHFHTPWNPVMQTQMMSLLPPEAARVATFHDTPPDRGIGKWFGGWLMRKAAPWYVSKLNAGISVSRVQREAMGGLGVELASRMTVIPNGVRLQPERKASAQESHQVLRMLFIGRLEPRKGVLDLIELYKMLVKESGQHRIELDVVGDGPLRRHVEELGEGFPASVRLHIKASEEMKNALLASADLLLAPSLYGESFGIVLLEAMAHGVIPLGYGNPGYLTLARDYCVENFPPPGDLKALVARIRTLMADASLRMSLREKGYETADQYRWERVANEILTVYDRAVRANRTRRDDGKGLGWVDFSSVLATGTCIAKGALE